MKRRTLIYHVISSYGNMPNKRAWKYETWVILKVPIRLVQYKAKHYQSIFLWVEVKGQRGHMACWGTYSRKGQKWKKVVHFHHSPPMDHKASRHWMNWHLCPWLIKAPSAGDLSPEITGLKQSENKHMKITIITKTYQKEESKYQLR